MYEGCTRNAYHLFMYRYQKEHFAGLSRKRFLEALKAEGVDCNAGYGRLNKEAFTKRSLASRSWQRLFPAETLAQWEARTECLANDKLPKKRRGSRKPPSSARGATWTRSPKLSAKSRSKPAN